MAKQPTFQDLGGVPNVTGARPVARYDVAPFARGAQEIAEAGARAGQALANIGDAGYEAERRRALSQAADANVAIHANLIEARSRYRDDPDYATLGERWGAESGKIVDDGVAGIDSPPLREHVRNAAAVALAQEAASVRDQAFRGAADAHAAFRERTLQTLIRNTTLDPNDALTTGAIDAYHGAVNDARDRGFLGAEGALAEKRRAALALCAAHYSLMGRADPARAVDELQSPDCPHPVAQFLPAEAKDGLVAQAQRASDAAEGNVIKDLLGPEPSVTATGIVNDTTLTPAAKARMVAFAARSLKDDPPAAVSQATTVDLLDRIRRPDGDPEKIADPGPIIEVLDERSTVFALLYLVEHVPAKLVRFAELMKVPLGGVAVGVIEARGHHYAQWRGPAKRWCVVGPNGTVVREGVLTKDEAERDVTARNTPTSLAFVSHPRM